MMKATELRIGNILNYTTAEGDVIQTEVCWQDLKWISEDPEGFNLVHSPVELNEEWLLKFGFEWSIRHQALYNGMFKIDEKYKYGYRFHFGNEKIDVKYVHQLQNLFNALTGEELKTT